MGKVQLKITSALASMLDAQSSDCLILEKKIGEGATIGDLLADLASSYTDFGEMLFDSATGKISDQLNVVLNDSLLPFPDMAEAKLNDGDSVILLPVYSGG